MALPQVCPVGAGAGVSGEGVPPALWPGRELPTPRAATRIPHLAWPTAVGTHSCTPWLPSPAPRACSPGLPLSPCAHSCACLLPSLGAPRPQAGEWIFPASVNKWWQHARWAGDRRGQHRSQGVPSTEAQTWGEGETGRHPAPGGERERERHSDADRQTDQRKLHWAERGGNRGDRK